MHIFMYKPEKTLSDYVFGDDLLLLSTLVTIISSMLAGAELGDYGIAFKVTALYCVYKVLMASTTIINHYCVKRVSHWTQAFNVDAALGIFYGCGVVCCAYYVFPRLWMERVITDVLVTTAPMLPLFLQAVDLKHMPAVDDRYRVSTVLFVFSLVGMIAGMYRSDPRMNGFPVACVATGWCFICDLLMEIKRRKCGGKVWSKLRHRLYAALATLFSVLMVATAYFLAKKPDLFLLWKESVPVDGSLIDPLTAAQ